MPKLPGRNVPDPVNPGYYLPSPPFQTCQQRFPGHRRKKTAPNPRPWWLPVTLPAVGTGELPAARFEPDQAIDGGPGDIPQAFSLLHLGCGLTHYSTTTDPTPRWTLVTTPPRCAKHSDVKGSQNVAFPRPDPKDLVAVAIPA